MNKKQIDELREIRQDLEKTEDEIQGVSRQIDFEAFEHIEEAQKQINRIEDKFTELNSDIADCKTTIKNQISNIDKILEEADKEETTIANKNFLISSTNSNELTVDFELPGNRGGRLQIKLSNDDIQMHIYPNFIRTHFREVGSIPVKVSRLTNNEIEDFVYKNHREE